MFPFLKRDPRSDSYLWVVPPGLKLLVFRPVLRKKGRAFFFFSVCIPCLLPPSRGHMEVEIFYLSRPPVSPTGLVQARPSTSISYFPLCPLNFFLLSTFFSRAPQAVPALTFPLAQQPATLSFGIEFFFKDPGPPASVLSSSILTPLRPFPVCLFLLDLTLPPLSCRCTLLSSRSVLVVLPFTSFTLVRFILLVFPIELVDPPFSCRPPPTFAQWRPSS